MARTQYPNLNAVMTANGNLAIADDQHNPDSTGDLDKVDDWYSSALTPIPAGVTGFGVSLWVFQDTAAVVQYVMNQRPSSYVGTAGAYEIAIYPSGAIQAFYRQNNNADNLGSVSAAGAVSTGVWKHVMASWNISTLDANIYVNGSEVAYSATKDSVVGTPTAPSAMSTLAVGSFFNYTWSTGFDGKVSRPTFFTTFQDASAASTEYSNEVAAIGEGFVLVTEADIRQARYYFDSSPRSI